MSPALLHAAWDELLAEIDPECDGETLWCSTHRSKVSNGRCYVGRAIDDMAAELASYISQAEGTPNQ